MSREEPGRVWRTPPRRHSTLAPPQRRDSFAGAIAVGCFLLAIILTAIFLPEII